MSQDFIYFVAVLVLIVGLNRGVVGAAILVIVDTKVVVFIFTIVWSLAAPA